MAVSVIAVPQENLIVGVPDVGDGFVQDLVARALRRATKCADGAFLMPSTAHRPPQRGK